MNKQKLELTWVGKHNRPKLEPLILIEDQDIYWQHGYSSESDYIYVTTQFITQEKAEMLSDEVGRNRSLLICCSAFKLNEEYANLTFKKIPQSVLDKCEWGQDDYSLEVENLPELPKRITKELKKKFGKARDNEQLELFTE